MKFEIGKRYNFDTAVPIILGNHKELMEVVSICNLEQAMKYEDVLTKHEIISPHLPAKLMAKDLTYIVFKSNEIKNNYEVIAYEYILPDTINYVEKININIIIEDISSGDIQFIMETLASVGYINAKVNKYIK